MIQRLKTNSIKRKSNPNSVFSDPLSMLLSNYNLRTLIINDVTFDKMSIDRAYTIADERYRDASDSNFEFAGNIDTVTMKPLFEKYIGSIASDYRKEFWVNHNVEPAKVHFIRKIYCDMTDPKAIVYVSFHSKYPCTPENVEYLNAISFILNMRYVEIIRDQKSGTYGVSVQPSLTSKPANRFSLILNFTRDPEREEYQRGLLLEAIAKLKKEGVTDDEVKETWEYFILNNSERLKNDNFLIDRVKNYICNGIYTPLPQYSMDIYRDLDGEKIQVLVNILLRDNYFEFVMLPATK